MDERVTHIQALVEPILAERGMELVELTVRPQGRQQLVRLLVDKVGGVTIQQCATVNGVVGAALESADVLEGSYTIEVSSPGLDRPLTSKRDFERALGEELLVQTVADDGRARELSGMLLAVQHEAIVVKTLGGNVTVPWSAVRSANKAIQW